MNINLKYHKIPKKIRQFTETEEKALFPKHGERVLVMVDGEFKIFTFSWMYASFKTQHDRSWLRDGNGDSIWSDDVDEDNDGLYLELNEHSRDNFPFDGWWKFPTIDNIH